MVADALLGDPVVSVFVNGRWEWYRPEWSVEFCAYVDRQRAEGYRKQNVITCCKCGSVHTDPHINGCSSLRDQRDPTHTPDWGTF